MRIFGLTPMRKQFCRKEDSEHNENLGLPQERKEMIERKSGEIADDKFNFNLEKVDHGNTVK